MLLTFKEAVQQIKDDTERLLPLVLDPGKSEGGKMRYICPDPTCQHGEHGGGISFAREYGETSDNSTLYCYKCHWKGSIIDAYMLKYGQTYRTAVYEIADLDSITIIDENDRTERPQTASKGAGAETIQKSTEEPTETNKAAQGHREYCAAHINALLPAWQSDAAREYLTGRGITEETAARFNLRYDPAQGFYDRPADKWINIPAVVFPYNSNSTYYSARSIEGKYFYKPSEEKAGKEPLFNPAALFAEGPCFVCESQIDAISIAQAGGQAVAIGGTDGYKKIVAKCESENKRPAAPLILLYDNDDTGREEQPKLEAELTAAGIPYMIAQIDFDSYREPHKDANDLLRADPDRLAEDIRANVKEANKSEIERFLDETYTQKYKGVPTGLDSLDNLLNGGFIPQTLILLSAEPGAGKTALATQIFENIAAAGHPCIYLNLEMSKQQMLARSIARQVYFKTRYSGSKLELSALNILRGYEQTEATRDRVRRIALEFENRVLTNLQYNPANVSNSLDDILQYIDAEAQRATAAGLPAPYICVDYLHIMTGAPGEDPAEMLKRAVFKLKEYAERYNSIVLAIMAQGRGVNNSNKATMSAGRDTSGLEYTADLQMQLLTSEEGLKNDEIALHITKSRFTQTKMREGLKFGMFGAYSYLEERGTFTPGGLDFDDTIEDDSEPQTKGHKSRRRKSADRVKPAEAEPQDAYWENSDFIDFSWPEDED